MYVCMCVRVRESVFMRCNLRMAARVAENQKKEREEKE
jgi:hypothetical protein